MRMQVLGPVRAWRGDRPIDLGSSGQRAVLGLLALADGQPMSRIELISALWGEHAPLSATNMIQSRIKHLRKALEPGRQSHARSAVLPMVGDGYALEVSAVDLDLSRFRRLVHTATAAQQEGDLPRVAHVLAEALRLWHGLPLADIPALATHPKVTALVDQRRAAVARYGDAMLATGAAVDVLPVLEEAAADGPLDEAACARLIRAYLAVGRRARAFTAYHEMRRRLADELGVDPGPELVAAHNALLHDNAGPTATSAVKSGGALTANTRTGDGSTPLGSISAVDSADTRATRRPKPAQLPADIAAFAGRDTQLRQLDELLPGGTGTRAPIVAVIAFSGAAGVGKTALATHWAHQVRKRFTDGQLYVNLRGFDPTYPAAAPADVIKGFLDAFGIPPQQMPTGMDALIGLYRSVLADKRVLIVLDNAHDAEQVRPLLPGAPGCLVIVTSRNRLTSLVAAERAWPLALDMLTAAESHDLMVSRLGTRRVAAEPDAVREIVDRCGRLPLALAIVAARAATDPALPLAELAGQLRGARSALDVLAAEDATSDVRAAFSLSYHVLPEPAGTLFRLLGLHAGPDITVAAAASLAGVVAEEARSLLGQLVRVHLVTEPNPGRYRLHDLLHAYAADLAGKHDPEVHQRAAVGRLLDHYLHTACAAALELNPNQDPVSLAALERGAVVERFAGYSAALDWFTTEHAVVVAAIQQAVAGGWHGHAWRLARAVEEFFNRRGHWGDWVITQRIALDAGRKLADQGLQAGAHRGLARAYTRLGRFDDAHAHFASALDLFAALGDRVGQADVLLGISYAWVGQGNHREALRHAQRGLDLYRAAGHGRGQATALNMMGSYQTGLADYRQALVYCEQALALHQEIGDYHGEADTWDSLGYLRHRLGQHEQAAADYNRALKLYQHVGAVHYEADTLAKLGESQLASGDVDAARSTWRRALTLLDEIGLHTFVDCDADQIRANLRQIERPERTAR